MKKLVLIIAVIFYSSYSNAQTNVSGSLMANTTWNTSGNPYIVSGNLVIFEGVLLTIEPGVIVKFEQNAGLELRGTLHAIGTSSNPIEFTSNLAVPTKGSWEGLQVIGTSNPLGVGNQVMMKYVNGMYAKTFIDLNIAYHGPYSFNNCYFAFNLAVNKDGGLPSTIFENCQFVSNDNALTHCQFESTAKYCDFINNVNGLEGIRKVDSCYFKGNTGIALSPYGSTNGCKVENNNVGVSCTFNSTNHTFTNNTVINNQSGIEMLTFFNGTQVFTGNTICHNNSNNIKLLTTSNANLSNNCWCTTDSSQIRANIYDGYVNNAYGLVTFMPISSNCPQNPLVINTISKNDDIHIHAYPNPFQNTLMFNADEKGNYSVNLYDLTGRKILNQTFSKSTQINSEYLKSGLYIYEVICENRMITNGKVFKD